MTMIQMGQLKLDRVSAGRLLLLIQLEVSGSNPRKHDFSMLQISLFYHECLEYDLTDKLKPRFAADGVRTQATETQDR